MKTSPKPSEYHPPKRCNSWAEHLWAQPDLRMYGVATRVAAGGRGRSVAKPPVKQVHGVHSAAPGAPASAFDPGHPWCTA